MRPLFLALSLAAAAAAQTAAPFTAEAPAGWERSDSIHGPDRESTWTKGGERIRAARYGAGGSKYATLGDFVRSLEAESSRPFSERRAKVGGRRATMWSRETPAAGGKAAVREEVAILSGEDSFWVLSWRREGAAPSGGRRAWKRFLKTFSPASRGS